MSTQVTLTLPDELYEQAKRWAIVTQRDLSETLTDALAIVLTPVYTSPELEQPITNLADDELLALTQLQMKPAQGERLGELLKKQREGLLTDAERSELLALAQIYEQFWLRQSEALAEAVRRGLRSPLEP